jgi:ribose/xylose/arabinose/galactoside ABC-type transport system permease subunit
MNAADATTGSEPSVVARLRGRLRPSELPKETVLVVLLILLAVYFNIRQPIFGSTQNIHNLAGQSAVLAMMAAGQLFVIIGRGIDISVGAQVSLLSILAVELSLHMSVPLAFAITILAGCLIGLINGLMITVLRISPIITTVATLQIMSGLALIWTSGLPKRNFSSSYTALGANDFLGIPLAAILAAVVAFLAWVLLHRSKFGRYTFAIGGNPDAAHLSGISVNAVTTATYVVCSLFTALAAITLSSKVGSGQAALGNGLEITTVAAVFIGGVAWGGGSGTVVGAMLGVLLISMLGNGLDLSAVSSNVQTVVTGVLMAVAVGISQFAKRPRRRGVIRRAVSRLQRGRTRSSRV